MVWGWRARLHERSKKTPTQLHTLRATRTSATCAQSCGRAGRLRIVDEEFEMLLLLKGVVHLNLLFEHQVVLDDCSADSGCFGRLQFGQPLAKPDERVCRGLPSERAVCVCEAVSVEKGARRRPLPAAVVCPPAGRQLDPHAVRSVRGSSKSQWRESRWWGGAGA